MTFHYKPATLGFTLIELLITLAIAGVVMSLVAPLAIEQVEKMERRSELSKIRSQLHHWSFMAFARSCPITLRVDEAEINLLSESCHIQRTVSFEHLRFPEQELEISISGYTSKSELRYFTGGERSNEEVIVVADALLSEEYGDTE